MLHSILFHNYLHFKIGKYTAAVADKANTVKPVLSGHSPLGNAVVSAIIQGVRLIQVSIDNII